MNNRPTIIAGRYEITDRLGQGGMGSLYRARDPILDRLVAIKVLREGFDSEEMRQRFVREARAAARLNHRNVVTIYDFGEFDGQPFIVMEYLRGETLADLIRQQRSIPLARKLQYVEDLCMGLAFAHRAGIVHRDVKPANVMVDPEGIVKVLDFGVARFGDSGMTQGGLLGTLNYMAPEQIAGTVDQRSDIFAVGAVLYELLAYRRAFPGGLEDGVLHKILNEPPPPLAEFCPNLDPAITQIVQKALDKDPVRRYQDLTVMRSDLERVRVRLETEQAERSDSPTIALGPLPPLPTPSRTPRRTTDREAVARLRADQIEAQLTAARNALESGDFEAAIAAGEQVLVLEADNQEAIDLIDRARAGLDERQIHAWLDEAGAHLAQDELTAADAVIAQVFAQQPRSAAAQALHQAVDEARRARDAARLRQAAITEALAAARAALARSAAEEAIVRADSVLALDREHVEAAEIRAAAVHVIEKRRVREEEARKAREAAERQAREEEARKAREAAEQKAREEEARKAREAAERKAREEEARKAREAAEQRAREEEARKAREAAEQKAREEEARKAREAAERKAREEEARKAREAAERKAREEEAHKAREAAEQKAREQEARKAREAAEQRAREKEARKARVEDERRERDATTAVLTPVARTATAGPRADVEAATVRIGAKARPPEAPAASPQRRRLIAIAAILVAAIGGTIVWQVIKPNVDGGEKVSTTTTSISATTTAPTTTSIPPGGGGRDPVVLPMVSVTIDAKPWARVKITPVAAGVTLADPEVVTPISLMLPEGEYTLELQSGVSSRRTNERIRVKAGEANAFRYALPGFNADAVVSTLVGVP